MKKNRKNPPVLEYNADESDEGQPITVANVGFLLDHYGKECHPLQQIRELTKNSIEAIQRTTSRKGRIEWAPVNVQYTTSDGNIQTVRKLTCTDNGDGMTGPEMQKYLGALSSSSGILADNMNFGIGAKIASATRNPQGLVYLSWKDGVGSKIRFFKRGSEYILQNFEVDGDILPYDNLTEREKPKNIEEHGTQVLLMGTSLDDDTTRHPPEVKNLFADRWLPNALNMRFFTIPEGIEISVSTSMESSKDRNRLIYGQKFYLDENTILRGVFHGDGVNAHWWVTGDPNTFKEDRTRMTHLIGHVGSLYQNEIHDIYRLQEGGYAKLQECGITEAQKRVIIYFEPTNPDVIPNAARTQLLLNGRPIPLSNYAEQFRKNMPPQLKRYMEELIANRTGNDYAKSYKSRINYDLFDLSAVKAFIHHPKGTTQADPTTTADGGSLKPNPKEGTSEQPQRGHRPLRIPPNVGHLGKKGTRVLTQPSTKGITANPIASDFTPTVKWVKDGDEDWEEEMTERAGVYDTTNRVLKINSDFSVITDYRARFLKDFSQAPGVNTIVNAAVECHVEQLLVEVVIGVHCLKGFKEWTLEDRKEALSSKALSAALMPRTRVYQAILNEVRNKLTPDSPQDHLTT